MNDDGNTTQGNKIKKERKKERKRTEKNHHLFSVFFLSVQVNNIRWLSPELIKNGTYGNKSRREKKERKERKIEKSHYLMHIL
jgi:hypothetical protein